MPVQLPPQASVNLPAQPQDPPTLADVVAARSYLARVEAELASLAFHATLEDAARAEVYKTNIIMAHSAEAAAPAWFKPAVTAILAPIKMTLAQTRNFQFHDGSFLPFLIVPFNDGSMPTEAPHNLPPLVNADAIRALTDDQTSAYVARYGLGNFGSPAEGREAIARQVGCTAPIQEYSLDL